MSIASHRFNNNLRYRDGDHEGQEHLTPCYALEPVREILTTIELDPCTTAANPTMALVYYTVEDDGLTQPWDGSEWTPNVFCNPPYGRAREPWVEKCIEAGERGQKVILLIPAATDTRIFQRALGAADECVLVRGRLKFGILRENRRQKAASHGSALLGWNVSLNKASHLGMVISSK